VERLVKEAEEHADADRRRREVRRVKNRLEGLIYTNERVLEQFADILSNDDRRRVSDAMSQARGALASEDRADMEAAMFDLNTVSRILSEVMLDKTSSEE
jgi:molecular chaperone DnaK